MHLTAQKNLNIDRLIATSVEGQTQIIEQMKGKHRSVERRRHGNPAQREVLLHFPCPPCAHEWRRRRARTRGCA